MVSTFVFLRDPLARVAAAHSRLQHLQTQTIRALSGALPRSPTYPLRIITFSDTHAKWSRAIYPTRIFGSAGVAFAHASENKKPLPHYQPLTLLVFQFISILFASKTAQEHSAVQADSNQVGGVGSRGVEYSGAPSRSATRRRRVRSCSSLHFPLE